MASISRSARERPEGPNMVARYICMEACRVGGFRLCTLRMLKTFPARSTAASYSCFKPAGGVFGFDYFDPSHKCVPQSGVDGSLYPWGRALPNLC